MSYLLQHVRRDGAGVERAARIAERSLLNFPGFYGDAHVRVFVEDTSGRRGRTEPRIELEITDCSNEINLEFSLRRARDRENSLHKIDTLLGTLTRFRDALAAEAELAARREYR